MKEGLGFGCVRLTSNYTKKQALRNLEVAFENGVTHFDVAPLYGFGLAEGMLGDFAKNKRNKITIATKFGIAPNSTLLKNLFLQNVIRSAYRMVKGSPLQKSTAALSATTKTATNFSIANAEQSLTSSLRELKSDYVDFLLLHEALIEEANRAELIDFLEKKKSAGLIKEYGIASFANTIAQDYPTLNSQYTVLQTNNSFPFSLPDLLGKAGRKKFYFSPFLYLNAVEQLFLADPDFAQSISDLLGFDVSKSLTDLFLMHQLLSDPEGTTLFTSSKNEKIIGTIESWKRVKSMASTQHAAFPKVQQLIRERL
jgi:diketogulonate reductase-like aldo/keto reductase